MSRHMSHAQRANATGRETVVYQYRFAHTVPGLPYKPSTFSFSFLIYCTYINLHARTALYNVNTMRQQQPQGTTKSGSRVAAGAWEPDFVYPQGITELPYIFYEAYGIE